MAPEETGSRRSHGYVPWLLAGVGAASLVGWTLAGICSWRTNQACTVGFTVGPLVPAGSPAPEAPDVAARPAPRATPSAASRTAIDSPPATQVARAPATTMQVPSAGNPETANPDYVALVIGNARYETQTKLKNPQHDARAIADSLRSKNYTLVGGGPQLDLTRDRFLDVLDEFRAMARDAKLAFVYYAGHGIQIDDKEPIYLIPIDAKLQRQRDLRAEAIELSYLQDLLPSAQPGGSREQYGVMVLDACRTSNFPLEGLGAAQRQSGQRGLKAATAKDRSFIAFSASKGEPASDGSGQNSPYVEALLKAMEPRKRQLPDIKDVFSRIDETFKNNGQLQDPEKSDKLGDRKITLAAPQKPRPVGWTGRDCPQCPEIRILARGKFTIGSPATEVGSYDDERPQTEIEFTKPFAVGITEVTFDEFDACVAAGFCTTRPKDEGWGRGNLPVINVTWEDAQQYAQWLLVMTGNNYRLLSEAEWEYAARAGTRSAYPWGNTARRDRANYGGEQSPGDGLNGKAEGADRWRHTAPVRSFPANPWGLFDMHGNVFEWVEDCYEAAYSVIPRDGSAYTPEPCKDNIRSYRGGSWDSTPAFVRSAVRDGDATSRTWIGFRIARDN